MRQRIPVYLAAALLVTGCTNSEKLAKQCEQFYAETGNPKYHGKADCRDDVAEHFEEIRRNEAATKEKVEAERVAKKVLSKPVEPPPDEIRARLFTAFAPKICADLKQSNSTARMDLTLLSYTDNEPLYSLHEVYPPGSADMQSSLYTLKGKQFCVDGGISGGDCVHRLSDRHSHGSVHETGTISELKTLLKCP